MLKLPLPLKIAVLDTDITSTGVLKAILETKPDIEEVRIFTNTKAANNAFLYEGFNSLFIDIFSLGVKIGIDFIKHIRAEYPIVSICLYSSSSSLQTMPGVNDYWRNRFGHYFKLSKDQTIQTLDNIVDEVLWGLAGDVQAEMARNRVIGLRKMAEETPQDFTPEQKREIEETATVIEKALEVREEAKVSINVPGVNTGQMERLVNDTLVEASRSLQLTTRVNIGVLAAGSLLMLISFIVASITNRWEAVAFGGFGIAGIVAALITNPLKSIGASARRLVQVQVAYLSFLSQLAILNQDSENTTVIERSERLETAMAQTLKTLAETT